MKFHLKKENRGVSVEAQRKRIQLGTVRLRVPSPALLSGLRIQGCCELWFRWQTRLEAPVAVAVVQAGGYSSHSGTSRCHGYGPYKQNFFNKVKKHRMWHPWDPQGQCVLPRSPAVTEGRTSGGPPSPPAASPSSQHLVLFTGQCSHATLVLPPSNQAARRIFKIYIYIQTIKAPRGLVGFYWTTPFHWPV